MSTAYTKELKPGGVDIYLTWDEAVYTWNDILGTWDSPIVALTGFTKESKPSTSYTKNSAVAASFAKEGKPSTSYTKQSAAVPAFTKEAKP